MKRSFIILSALVSALVAPVLTGSASAAEISYASVSGNWHDPVNNLPGSQPGDPGYPVITNGTPTSIIRWGTTNGTPQSGYDFTATIPPPFTLPGPIPFFSLGTFTHRNFEVGSPSLTSVQLDVVLVLSVDGVPTGPLTFTFTLNHHETPNDEDPCPYPTPPNEGCTDRVTIVASPQPTTFNVGGVDYTLSMSFLDENGEPVSEFITREGGTINTSGLVGQFTLPGVPPDTPVLTVEKSGPATMSPGQWGDFVIDVQDLGLASAFNVTLVDRLPDGPTGGMCDTAPEVLSARVFAADGVTPVPGKGPLAQGTDYSLVYDSGACELTFNTLSAASVIGASERLVIGYRTQLDPDTQDGIALTNVAGATQWFNGDSGDPDREQYTRTLTNGTVGTVDHEDAHTVTADLAGHVFEKTVVNLTSGANPATTAAPGDTLRYTLRVQTTDQPLDTVTVYDELDAMNATPAFAPGTLTLVSVPPGVDASATSATGGANGTGVIDVRNLSLPAGSQAQIVFDVTLAPVIASGSIVTNQASLRLGDTPFALSDDPNVNGPADPSVVGDEDPTRVPIDSLPVFRVQKISDDITGDPNLLLAGDTLRYTINVLNTGTSDASNVTLRDQIPANTTYVAGSTTLNGASVADNAGTSPLVGGLAVNAPSDPTPGALPADLPTSPDNVATIIFDVVIDPAAVDGTVISNQGFVSAVDAGIVDYPSDDPATPAPNDPTVDRVGNPPLLFAPKRVELIDDQGTPGIVDPGDVLRYTISVQNSGTVAATGVVLRDAVPANTTYVADTTFLNGLPVGQPDGGASPLASGLDISSSDLTPPLPGAGAGTISAGASAVLQFDLRVNDGVPEGTLISNQAVVDTVELPDLLTDGDGNPATGPEPTVVVVGAAQQVTITKQVSVVGGGPALPGATLEYVVTVTNVSALPALYVVITDDLDTTQTGYLTYVDQSATLNDATTGVSFAGTTLTADYATAYGNLEPGASAILRFRATIAADLAMGTRITNTGVVTWSNPPQTASASVSIDIGGMAGVGILNGTVWHDTDFDDALDAGERVLEGWTVDLLRDGELVTSTVTDATGVYRISGLAPNYLTGQVYELRFLAPGAVATTAALGRAASDFTNYMQRITDIVVQPGSNLLNLDLPIDPNGVAYNSVTRSAVAGAVLTLLDADTGTELPASCFDDPAHQRQVTLASGWYKFEINFSDPACPSGGNYLIAVTVPGGGYVAGYSEFIPPTSGPSTAPFAVPSCPASADDAIAGTTQHCEVQPSEFAPAASVPARSAGTNYHVHLLLDGTQLPGSSQLYNNHLPLDPTLDGAVAIAKTTPMLNVTRGQLVPYRIAVHNQFEVALPGVTIIDRYPAGFVYVEGSARLDGVPVEPTNSGRELGWSGLTLAASGQHELVMLLAVGAGVTEGEFVNRAQAVHGPTGNALSGEATATVRVVPDPTFDCTDVTGKVFDDANRNRVQDDGEGGLAGVRVVTTNGLAAITDAHGRFHITCAITPIEGRGSNLVLKLDDRTLPSGYRPSTESAQVQRATRGKALKFGFGASIHRVVALDVADAVFEPGTTDIRIQWQPRLQLLLDELAKAPAVLRLSYLADVEDRDLVERRVQALREQITESWEGLNLGYQLTIEPEVFWRLGGPPEKSAVREPSGR
jgi:uncharacterized repeat protein (TIGR01451 family)/fimbrial isopeptide formation D2 family protein